MMIIDITSTHISNTHTNPLAKYQIDIAATDMTTAR